MKTFNFHLQKFSLTILTIAIHNSLGKAHIVDSAIKSSKMYIFFSSDGINEFLLGICGPPVEYLIGANSNSVQSLLPVTCCKELPTPDKLRSTAPSLTGP